MSKKIWELNNEEMDVIVKEAARKAIAETHAAGRPSTHGDEKGILSKRRKTQGIYK